MMAVSSSPPSAVTVISSPNAAPNDIMPRILLGSHFASPPFGKHKLASYVLTDLHKL